ncbi:hypothetical protein [Aldersonia kunmingensis]|uniref:hypothetical protein n=1 Tax=Aldersonia kunmingensis TaxID=408066 RepID=UPI000AE3468D|nr:hypothetical protein [Aldersonia kunmingensis]
MSSNALDGWRDAALSVLAAGRTPIVPLEALRALWRRGGADRELAEDLHALAGVIG